MYLFLTMLFAHNSGLPLDTDQLMVTILYTIYIVHNNFQLDTQLKKNYTILKHT